MFIDAENVGGGFSGSVVSSVRQLGEVSTVRIFGGQTSANSMKSWRAAFVEPKTEIKCVATDGLPAANVLGKRFDPGNADAALIQDALSFSTETHAVHK